MSYSSRVYRQRNPHTQDEGKQDAFFGKQSDTDQQESSAALFQAKLAVNKPKDKFEQEADSVANAVTNKTSPNAVQNKKIGSIQRLSSSPEDEKLSTNDARMKKDKDIQRKPAEKEVNEEDKNKDKLQKKDEPKKEEEKGPADQQQDQTAAPDEKKEKKGAVQKKPDGNSSQAGSQLSSKIDDSAGQGNALPPETLQEMNSSFGVDFSEVSIHTDAESENMNKDLQAQAFTHGKDIYFNKGKFNDETKEGKNLLAHELTHVVQQNSD